MFPVYRHPAHAFSAGSSDFLKQQINLIEKIRIGNIDLIDYLHKSHWFPRWKHARDDGEHTE